MKALIFAAMAALVSLNARAQIVTQENKDVQVLQAWSDLRQTYNFYSPNSYDNCERADWFKPEFPQSYAMDCSKAVGITAPLAAPILIPFWQPEGRAPESRYGSGTTVEIRVVVSRAVLESGAFRGVGFYANTAAGPVQHLIPKEKLQIASREDVYLASNGERAVVLRFVLGFGTPNGISGTSWGYMSIEFKPFAEFEANGTTYRNYESVPQNFRIYRARYAGGLTQVDSINREYEILKR